MIYHCLSIAGFDGSGGAGIQADLKTFSALGCYGTTVLTALPIQNTCGVRNCYTLPLSAIEEQLSAIFDDIPPHAIKIGMLFSSDIIYLVSDFIKQYAKNIPLVIDPAMMAKSGDALLKEDAIHALKSELIPLATIITPNLPEARMLTSMHQSKEALTQDLMRLGCQSILLKGGHDQNDTADDWFLDSSGQSHCLSKPRIATKNTHGTGCTLSAAITAFLSKRLSPLEACQQAKEYLHGALVAAKDLSIGKGHGPLHHFYQQW